MASINSIISGRKVVDAYRDEHSKLQGGDNTYLLKKLISDLKECGFISIREFFQDNELLVEGESSMVYQREGNCNNCGKCCGDCQYLTKKGECSIYTTRPESCKPYPTAKDFIRGLLKECSYRFVETGESDIDLRWR